jgi:hypothetical protein
MHSLRFAVAVVLTLATTTANRATADIWQVASVDLAVAEADVVVRGGVVEITCKKIDGVVWSRVTVKVKETIKGKKAETLTFLDYEEPLRRRRTEPWKDMRADMLFVLVEFSPRAMPLAPFREDHILRAVNLNEWAIDVGPGPLKGAYYDATFKRITDPEKLLEAARNAATFERPKKRLGYVDKASWRAIEIMYPDNPQIRAAATKMKISLNED